MASADIEAATALKLQGNKAFAKHDWPVAVDFYTQAIAKYDREPSFFCNRAQVTSSYPLSVSILAFAKTSTRSMLTVLYISDRRISSSRHLGLRLPMPPRH